MQFPPMAAAPDPPTDDARGAGRNLPAAIAVGLVLAALFLATMAIGPWAFLTFAAAILVVAQLELDSAFRAHGAAPATPVAIGAGLVMLYGAYAAGEPAQVAGVVVLLLGAMLWALRDVNRHDVAAGIAATCLTGLWVPFLASFVGLLLRRGDGGPDGRLLLMAVTALTVTSDIGAYAFGNRWGRHRMAPSVSPGKTWEGFAGGLVTVLALAGLVTARIIPSLGVLGALALGAGVAVAATLGDLSESLVKRGLGVKDLGRILPGHGGVMDRIDAMLFALPVAHFILVAFGL
ncbi:MAG: phosphatidate cytidylyltransferase [Egibacteraceae bacterium]